MSYTSANLFWDWAKWHVVIKNNPVYFKQIGLIIWIFANQPTIRIEQVLCIVEQTLDDGDIDKAGCHDDFLVGFNSPKIPIIRISSYFESPILRP